MVSADVARRRPEAFRPAELREPGLARFLFADTRASIIWLIVRIYLGWQWLEAGWEKVQSPAWTGDKGGAALTGFVNGALKQTGGEHPNVQGWYATFLSDVVLPNARIWGALVAWGETLVGVALILGALTGIAAFFGVVMNANYLLAGAVSTNPILIILGALVMMAWRNAGWLGLDRWLLPILGTPWQPGSAFATRDRRGVPREPDLSGSAAPYEARTDLRGDERPAAPPERAGGAYRAGPTPAPADRTVRTDWDDRRSETFPSDEPGARRDEGTDPPAEL